MHTFPVCACWSGTACTICDGVQMYCNYIICEVWTLPSILVPSSCVGFGLRPQAEYCHYHMSSRNYCGPHAQLLLDNLNISAGNGQDICKCGYKGGKKSCIACKKSVRSLKCLEMIIAHFVFEI